MRHDFSTSELRSWLRDDVAYRAPETFRQRKRGVSVYAYPLAIVAIVLLIVALAAFGGVR